MEIAAAKRPVSELLKILFHIIILLKKIYPNAFSTRATNVDNRQSWGGITVF
jgi:hypothetical protein